jgi:hypothetical protein
VVVSVGNLGTLLVTPICTASLNLSFSIVEMQVIATTWTLLENFEFTLPLQTAQIYITRKPLVLMVPMVEDIQYPWMGLKVRCVD